MTVDCMTLCPLGHRGYLPVRTVPGTVRGLLVACSVCGRPARCYPLASHA
jgi:hypothetical protein